MTNQNFPLNKFDPYELLLNYFLDPSTQSYFSLIILHIVYLKIPINVKVCIVVMSSMFFVSNVYKLSNNRKQLSKLHLLRLVSMLYERSMVFISTTVILSLNICTVIPQESKTRITKLCLTC
jgi:hypothetical protein